MRKLTFILLALVVMGCERFPTNVGDLESDEPLLSIDHLSTEYMTTATDMEGIISDKINILTFRVMAENCKLSVVEFIGTVTLNGPPGSAEQAIRFRTDKLYTVISGLEIPLEEITEILQGQEYIFKRPVFPTNEYSPFENEQGMVKTVNITEIWAYDTTGTSHRLTI
ncbi:hypothetical protein KAR48_19060 [bacterium]|nr:hypothetical protein [bacterium]